jgi:hypothetical protein
MQLGDKSNSDSSRPLSPSADLHGCRDMMKVQVRLKALTSL